MRPTWEFLSRTSALAFALLPTLRAQSITPTQTTLSISPSASAATTATITLTAHVTSTGSPIHPGTVLFCSAKAAHCEDSAILGTAQLTSTGTATLHLRLSPNTYSIKAIFQGTPHSTTAREPSTSANQSLTVTGRSASSVNPVTTSQSSGRYKLSATVAGFGASPLTGTASFSDTVLHGTPLVLGTASIASAPPGAQFAPGILSPPFQYSIIQTLTGDFNNDGLADVIAVSYDNEQDGFTGDSTILPFLSNGDGSFQNPAAPISTIYPAVLAAGDFNGDGNLDLVVYDVFDCLITPMLGNGDGTFTALTPISEPCINGPILVADLNGDGILDLFLTGTQTNTGSSTGPLVMLGNGDGSFTVTSLAPALLVGSPVLRDINGDGFPDIVLASDPIQILTGNGDGSFTAQPSIPYHHSPNSIDTADFNNDGLPDIVLANNDGTVGVLIGNGDGSFTAKPLATLPGATPGSVTAADFNGDGRPDALVLSGSTFTILFGNGYGTFGLSPFSATSAYNQAFSLGDFNGDGIPDLVTSISPNSYDTGIVTQLVQHTRQAVIDNLALQTDTDHTLLADYSGSTDHTPSVSPPFDLITLPNVTSKIRAISSGFIYSFVNNTFVGTLTVTNISSSAIAGPLQIGFTNLPSTITVANPTVPKNEGFFTIPGGLAKGASSSFTVRFISPINAPLTFNILAYTGAL